MTVSNRGRGWVAGAYGSLSVAGRSGVNTFSTVLGASESDTGEWEENDSPDFAITVDTDVSGTIFVDFSHDGGANFTTFPVGGFDAGPTKPPHSGRKFGRWMRVRYANGSDVQSRFILATTYGSFNPLNAPLGAHIAADADAEIVRSVSADLDLAFGRLGGMEEDAKFGYVDLLDSADTGTDVWAFGSDDVSGTARKTFPTVASTIYAVSDDTGDTDVAVTVPYLDATGAIQSEEVTLSGLARVRVSDTGDGLDCNRALESGSVAARGNVYITYGNDTGSGAPNDPNDVLAYIPIEYGQTQQATYRVPLNKKVRVKRIIITVSRSTGTSQTAARVHLRSRLNGGTWLTKRVWNLPVGDFSAEEAGLVFPPLAAIALHVSNVDESDTNVAGKFAFDEVDT
jgi:hypothetical protein